MRNTITTPRVRNVIGGVFLLVLTARGLGAGEANQTECDITINSEQMPEMKDWIETKLRPTLKAWYPKIVESLPSEAYVAPRHFTVRFDRRMLGVASTSGTTVTCAGSWFKKNLDGEAAGAVVHEMVHVVQQYKSPDNPGWLVEGVADYIRWFKYEPSELRPHPDPRKAKYTDSYRTTAAFLEYIAANHDHEFVVKINAAMREGRYSPDLWKQYTGKSVDELWDLFASTLKG